MSDEIDFAALIVPVARKLWGVESRQHSTPNNLRWGTNGSRSVHPFKGVWHDHETNEGGGTLDLIRRETGNADGDAVAWLREQGLVKANGASFGERQIETAYDYHDEEGNLLFQVCRTKAEGIFAAPAKRRRHLDLEYARRATGAVQAARAIPRHHS
jgi:putative DNA primase/helicase